MQEVKQEKSLIKQNILLYLDKKGVTPYEFYKISGVTRGVLSQNNGISEDNLARFLAYASDVNPDWLLTGEEPMLLDSTEELRKRLSYVLLLVGTEYASQYLNVDKYQLIDFCNGGELPANEFDFSRLLEQFPFNPNWLIKGKGEKYLSGTQYENEKAIRGWIERKHIEENNKIINAYLNPQPTINQENQGSPYYNVDFIGGFDALMNDQTINPDFYINYPPYNKEDVVWVNLTGRSMEPELSNGDIVALKPMNTPIQYLPTKEIYAIVTDEWRTVKRIELSDREGFIRLLPSNPEYKAQEIPIDMITKVYAVLGSIRKFF